MHFSLFELLLLIGCTQGMITSAMLFFTKKNKLSNKFLALAVLSFCFLSIKILLNTLGITQLPYFRYIPIAPEFITAPLFYFYVLSLITPNFKVERKIVIHFIPFIISQAYSFFVYFSILGISDMTEKDILGNALYFNEIKHYEDYVALISIFSYLVLVYLKLTTFRKQIQDNISDCSYPDFSWLNNIMILSGGLGLLLFANLSLDLFLDLKESYYIHWQVYFIYLACLIYYLGFTGYKQPDVDIPEIKQESEKTLVKKLSKEKLQASIEALNYALETDKVYLNPTINASDLAKQLNISQSHLSYIVNEHFNKSFRSLINDLRINEVKIKLQQKEFSASSILAIALDCGFNSEASFYRIFKRDTGMSPKEYAENYQKT